VAFAQVNPKVVAAPVAPGGEVLARRGAMLAYTGDVGFAPVRTGPGGVGGAAGRAVRGEQVPMMVARGSGTVYYGLHGRYLTLVELDGSGPLSVEADRLVAYDAGLQATVVVLGGARGAVRGAVTGQGLFTTQLHGVGSAALLSHGGTLALPVEPGRPTTVDPQAYVAHFGQVEATVSVHASWRDAVGRGAGEAIRLQLTGSGTVYVQASEQKV
jgi:uncharacterized protein (AIM24 family)